VAGFITKSLMGKLVTIFSLVVLVSVSIVGFLAFYSARSALEAAECRKLDSIREIKAESVRDYLVRVMDNAQSLSNAARARTAFTHVSSQERQRNQPEKPATGGPDPRNVSPVSGALPEQAKLIMSSVTGLLEDFFAINGPDQGYEDCLLIDAKEGNIFLTHRNLADLGANIRTGSLKDSGLAKVYDRVMKTQKPAAADMGFYPPVSAPMAFFGAPVFGDGHKLLGVIALRVGARKIDTIMHLTDSAGATADAYVVGADLLLRSLPRSHKDAQVMKTKVDGESSRLGLQHKTGRLIGNDYSGGLCFMSYGNIDMSKDKESCADFDWAIITGIHRDEAIQPVVSLGYRVLVIALAVAVIVSIVAFILARTIAKPILALAGQATRISEGDLTVEVHDHDRRDEIGVLNSAFEAMLDSLRKQTRHTLEGVNVLASSAAEISATVQQLSMSTTRTSSAVAETSTTVEEVKQAARVSSEKARSVSESSKQAVKISEEGKKATEDTIRKMSMIKEQMESVGETVVKLSEHSKAIEAIIATVQDLADQSNLLAVNASIEAARAGDQGKGFAVVAHEIKALADQSRNATEQVRGILQETRKWVTAVVMATEQGIKAADAGVQQSLLAGDSIEALSGSVANSSQAAGVIDTSTEQQFIGVDQVSSAMTNIEEAMQQNLTGTVQLEASAKRLQDLGDQLKQLVDRYRI
jgi:methyl-accepting chemotaxis protein